MLFAYIFLGGIGSGASSWGEKFVSTLRATERSWLAYGELRRLSMRGLCSQVGWVRLCAHAGSVNHTPAPCFPSQQPSHAHIPHHAHSGEMSNAANQPHVVHIRV